MFTGIVEHLGTASKVTQGDRGRTLTLDAGPVAAGVAVGDSIAINGTCLTVVAVNEPTLTFQAIGETLDRTNLGAVQAGDRVNLERPVAAAGRFDGHIVQGHVDGVGAVRSVEADGDGRRLWIDPPSSLLRYIVEKGSITVDGVSLTVAATDDAGFEVALIPHTLSVTTLGMRAPEDMVNIEVDVLAKYVERLLGASL
ncbi:MAG: riboflavin synthase [Acidimicrobiia bacterium]